MNRSDSLKQLAAALCKVQSEMEPAKRNAENPFFKSAYVDHSAAFLAVRDLLSVNGLAVCQTMSNGDPDRVTINTVLHSEVIDSAGRQIGYLVFNSFLGTSLAELEVAFQRFRLAGVDELILDLRYNGGGSVEVARRLASFIRRTETANRDLFAELRYNDRYQADNIKLYFEPEPGSIGVDELTVITTEMTCSASELVVAALQPYFTRVTTIGGRSCGKPVGMNPVSFCGQALLAVNFASFNAAGNGDFFDGLATDCPAVDDVSRDFGDPLEPMLQAAKYFIDNRVCQAMAARRQRPADGLSGLQAISGAISVSYTHLTLPTTPY